MQVSKSLEDMNARERTDLMSAVADALETAAGVAEVDGDAVTVANSMFLACSLRGCSPRLGTHDLKAAELLLQQGIMFVHYLNIRKNNPVLLH